MSERAQAARAVEHDQLADFFVNDEERELIRRAHEEDDGLGAPVSDALELLAFWLDTEEYAVAIGDIQEIIKVPEITEVPRLPAFVLGIISLRGTIVPVLDLAQIFRLGTAETHRASRILVLRRKEQPVGLLVERVTSVVRIDGEQIEPPPRSMQRGAVEMLQGVGRVNDQMLILLNVDSVLTVMEDIR